MSKGKQQHINNSLKNIPKKETPFKTPKDYFNKFSGDMKDIAFTESLPKKTGLKTPDNYLNKLSEQLSTIVTENDFPKKTGLQTPENYFENFTVKKPKSKTTSLIPYLSIAAAIVVGFFIFKSNSNNLSALDKLTNDEIISYLSIENDLTSSYLIENVEINPKNILFANLDNMDIEELEIEISEYDILDY